MANKIDIVGKAIEAVGKAIDIATFAIEMTPGAIETVAKTIEIATLTIENGPLASEKGASAIGNGLNPIEIATNSARFRKIQLRSGKTQLKLNKYYWGTRRPLLGLPATEPNRSGPLTDSPNLTELTSPPQMHRPAVKLLCSHSGLYHCFRVDRLRLAADGVCLVARFVLAVILSSGSGV